LAEITALNCFPVKGLSAQPLIEASLEAGAYFPYDRLFALENGASGFDASAPGHLPKMHFLMLMRNTALARLATHFDPATGMLVVRQDGEIVVSGDTGTGEGRSAIERFFEAFMATEARGPIRLLVAPPGFRFMDSRSGYVSILNRATIDALAGKIGRETLDPLRFRGNILLDGLPAFAENALVGQTIRLGGAELEVLKRIDRCAATDVAPGIGVRDARLVAALEAAYGHHDCGIYARVTRSGMIRIGDRLG
jgi:uncharacterized protein